MSNRERVIVALMAVAILYGAYELLFTGKPASVPAGQSTEDVTGFVSEISAMMATGSASKPDAQYVVGRASAPWSRDPFLPAQAVALFKAEPGEQEDTAPQEEIRVISGGELGLIYSGFLMAGSQNLAIINGLEYEVGERLNVPGGYVVMDISPEQVEVAREGSPHKIVIPLEEPEF